MPATDPAAAAARALGDDATATPRRSGRGGRRTGAGRPRGARTRSAAPAAAPPAEPEPPRGDPFAPIGDAELRGTAGLLRIAWRMLGTRLRRRPLTDEESVELASAAIPVLRKYGATFDAWAAELSLAVTVIGLWNVTELEVVEVARDVDQDPKPAPAA